MRHFHSEIFFLTILESEKSRYPKKRIIVEVENNRAWEEVVRIDRRGKSRPVAGKGPPFRENCIALVNGSSR